MGFIRASYEPVAHKYLLTNNGLLWGIVANNFQLLGCSGEVPGVGRRNLAQIAISWGYIYICMTGGFIFLCCR